MDKLSRRSLLGLGTLAGVGGVVGAVPTTAAAAGPAARTVVLRGRALRRLGGGSGAVGEVRSVRGALADDTGDEGEVFHTVHVVARRGDAGAVATVEQHLFVFPTGTLAGSGTVDHAGRGAFVVTGGTGRYAGARGGYTTRQSDAAAGGGEATYLLDLTTAL